VILMRKTEMFAVAVILLSFIVSAYFYPSMPDRMASHWDAQGEVNGYMPKFWALFWCLRFLQWCFCFCRNTAHWPDEGEYRAVPRYFDGFIALMLLFLFYIHLLSIYWNLGGRFNFIVAIVPAFTAYSTIWAFSLSMRKELVHRHQDAVDLSSEKSGMRRTKRAGIV